LYISSDTLFVAAQLFVVEILREGACHRQLIRSTPMGPSTRSPALSDGNLLLCVKLKLTFGSSFRTGLMR